MLSHSSSEARESRIVIDGSMLKSCGSVTVRQVESSQSGISALITPLRWNFHPVSKLAFLCAEMLIGNVSKTIANSAFVFM
jgi:hypothetical protein